MEENVVIIKVDLIYLSKKLLFEKNILLFIIFKFLKIKNNIF